MIVRVEKNKNFTIMSNYHLQDRNLSLKAKGLLSYMLSLPENWDYSVKGLTETCKESTNAINNALNELEKNDYLERRRKFVDGKISKWEYVIYEKQYLQNEDIENVDIRNPQQINTKEQNTKKQNTKKQKEKYIKEIFEKFWNAYPKKVDKQKTIKWFEKNKPTEELVDEMVSKLELFKKTKQWQNKQYIPNPTTWLNGHRWEDELADSDLIEEDDDIDVLELAKKMREEEKKLYENGTN